MNHKYNVRDTLFSDLLRLAGSQRAGSAADPGLGGEPGHGLYRGAAGGCGRQSGHLRAG